MFSLQSKYSDNLNIELAASVFELLPDKGLFFPAEKALLISDLHLGKSRHFRRNGLAVPAGETEATLNSLEKLILRKEAEKVFFLGDLFHSSINADWELLRDFVHRFDQVEFTLIKGNHDLFPNDFYDKTGIGVCDEFMLREDIVLKHEGSNQDQKWVICGHLHPAVRLKGKGRQSIKLSCFLLQEPLLILPAFGEFTGTKIVSKEKENRVFVCVEGEVIEV